MPAHRWRRWHLAWDTSAGNTLAQKLQPLTLRPKFHFGKNLVTDGVLNIYPRQDSLRHPIGGHIFFGNDAYPFVGHVDGLRLTGEKTKPRGRPSNLARDLGVRLAYDSIMQHAGRLLPLPRAKAYAKRECLALWNRWPGIQDDRALRRARGTADKVLKGHTALFTYTGVAEDFSDYVALLLLPGATWQTYEGETRIHGPAWVWRWGEEKAEHFHNVTAIARTPNAPDSASITLGGQ